MHQSVNRPNLLTQFRDSEPGGYVSPEGAAIIAAAEHLATAIRESTSAILAELSGIRSSLAGIEGRDNV